jgi:hypothetical protein
MRRKRNVGGGVRGTGSDTGPIERDFGGHVYQEKLHWFLTLRLSGFDVWKTGVKFSSIQRT